MIMPVQESRGSGMQRGGGASCPPEVIGSEKLQCERKLFFIDLKENHRGRVFKITEDVGGRRDTIMLPAAAARDFLEALERLVRFEEGLKGGGPTS